MNHYPGTCTNVVGLNQINEQMTAIDLMFDNLTLI